MARNVDSNTSEHPFRISFPCDKKSNQAKRARRSQGRAKGDQMEVDIWKRRSPSVCLSEIPPDPLDLGRWGLAERNRVSSAFGNIVPMAFNVARKTLPRDGGVRWPSRWFQSGWGQEMKAKRLVSGNHQLRVIIIELGERGWRKLSIDSKRKMRSESVCWDARMTFDFSTNSSSKFLYRRENCRIILKEIDYHKHLHKVKWIF